MARILEKHQVHYRNANYDQVKFCKSCKFIILDDNGCELVYGRVGYGYVCDLWKLGDPNASTPPRRKKP